MLFSQCSTIAAPNASCEFRDGYYTISCPKSDDTSLFKFINLVKGFIDMECDKAPEIFEVSTFTFSPGPTQRIFP